MEENLTKENFWNGMQERYPSEMADFCKWIDEYKKSVNWESLFAKTLFPGSNPILRTPKYHDLPLAIQMGIFFQFALERDDEDNGTLIDNAKQGIKHHFEAMERFKQREQAAGDGAYNH